MKRFPLQMIFLFLIIAPSYFIPAFGTGPCKNVRETLNNAIPIFVGVTANHNAIPRFEKFELTIDLVAGYQNAYDYSDIVVQGIFTAPSGRKDTVDGFFMQDYTLNADGTLAVTGTGKFKIRYAPREAGNWTYELSCASAGGTGYYALQSFFCTHSPRPGFIRKNSTNYLQFDDGNQFIPVGENMGWQNGNVVSDYTNWISKLTANGGNFIRIWMSSWAFGLEWKNGSNGYEGLKKYKQPAAYYLDWLLEYCRQNNVYVMTALNNHGQVSTGVNPEWANNPYNAANGGPAVNTWDFFTNTAAKDLHKNRLRYIIARYGYADVIQSWELFNEVDWTDQFESRKTVVKDWHREMADYIKSKDVYKHLVSTSFARDIYDEATWNIADIDFTQTHFYVDAPNIEHTIASATDNYITSFHKPTFNGEFGLGPDGSVLSTVDPTGIHFHNALWGTAFSGGMGPGLSWWWDDYIEPRNLYPHFKPLSTFLNSIPFVQDAYIKTGAAILGGGVADAMIVPAGDWGAATASNFTIDATGAISPPAAQLNKFLYGNIYNTQFRMPPSFQVTYPVAGQFKVVTAGSTGTNPQLNIYVDGILVLNEPANINKTYAVNVTAGAHTIKVDNLGTDWILVSGYIFSNIGSPLTTYVLKSADSTKASGYILNNNYNWKYLQSSGGVVPPVINGASLRLTGMRNGNCTVEFYSCSNAQVLNTVSMQVNSGILDIPLPAIAWDMAFRVYINAYYFIGAGNWNDASNWMNLRLPPPELPAGSEIIIDPRSGGECVLNVQQVLLPGSKISVHANKKFRVTGELNIQ